MNRQALGSRGEINRLYARIELSSAHFSISAISHQPSLRQQPLQYTLQLAERLPNNCRPRDDNDIKALMHSTMQMRQNNSQTPFAFIADYSFAYSSRGHDAITILGRLIPADADQNVGMPVDGARSLNVSVVGRPAQPQCSFHQLTGVPVCLLDMVRPYSEFVAATQPTSLKHTPSAARAHALAESMHTFTPANLRLPGTFG